MVIRSMKFLVMSIMSFIMTFKRTDIVDGRDHSISNSQFYQTHILNST